MIDQPWARRLALRGFASGFDKQYQSDPGMNRPYGGVEYGERSVGASVRYEQPLAAQISLDAVAGYAFTRGRSSTSRLGPRLPIRLSAPCDMP